jgi:GNAT superfamily N-acetyltransferase
MAAQSVHEITIRRLTKKDSPLLQSLCSNLREGVHLVAFMDLHPAGHLALLPIGDAADLTCFVRQAFRRQGVAKALMEAAIQEARAAHYSAILAFDDTHTSAVRRLLLTLRFEILWEVGEEVEYVYPLFTS